MRKLNDETRKYVFLIAFAMLLFTCAINIKHVIGIAGFLFSAASPVIAGLCIAFALNVPLTFFETKVFSFLDKSQKRFVHVLKKAVCIVLTLVFVFLIIALAVMVVVPAIIGAVKDIVKNMSEYSKTVPEWLLNAMEKLHFSDEFLEEYLIDRSTFINGVVEYLQGKAEFLIIKTASLTMQMVSSLFSLILSFVVAIYALVCKDKLKRFANRLLNCFASKSFAQKVRLVSQVAYNSFSRFIAGQAVENVILGVLCYVGMVIFGFPYAGVVAVITAVAQIVPIVGGIVSATAGALLMLTKSPLTALLFCIFIIIIQQIEGNLIYPKVVGKQVGLPGIAVLSTVIIGGNLFGILGILIGIPFVSTIYALIKIVMTEKEKKKAKENAPDKPF